HRDSRHAGRLERHGQPNDRWAARASKPYAEDGRIAIGLDARAQLGIIDPAFLRAHHANLGARQVFAKPGPQLFDEQVGVVEQTVDEIDRLAIEVLQAGRQLLPDDLRWVASRIVHTDRAAHSVDVSPLLTIPYGIEHRSS